MNRFEMENRIKYPVGIQTFATIREGGYVYVDKSELLYRLVHENTYVFLSRPRRFGKSLLMSTLHSYFKGRRELFQGLAIESLETEWRKHPVLHFDLSAENYVDVSRLRGKLGYYLRIYEEEYGLTPAANEGPGTRFGAIIRKAVDATGEKVVILIDEYEKPMLEALHDDGLMEQFRQELRGFYSVLKESDRYIRFAMLTGVTKFGQLSVFSGPNNLIDISLEPAYSTICGISESEFRRDFGPSVIDFARKNEMTEGEVWDEFRNNYDGYHFSEDSEGVYNPFSTLTAFHKAKIGAYWFASGTPNILVKILKKHDYPLDQINGAEVTAEELSDISDIEHNYLALFYQAGYLTIKSYDKDFGLYRLGFPNREVWRGVNDSLYRNYVFNMLPPREFSVKNFVLMCRRGEPEQFMQTLESLIATILPGIESHKEVHFQNVMQIVFRMLGFFVNTEISMATGRCGMTVEADSYVYVFEFKINAPAEDAIAQIRDKGYAIPYAAGHRKVYLIGASYSTQTNRLSQYIIEEL